jgi:hypothetical protein
LPLTSDGNACGMGLGLSGLPGNAGDGVFMSAPNAWSFSISRETLLLLSHLQLVRTKTHQTIIASSFDSLSSTCRLKPTRTI